MTRTRWIIFTLICISVLVGLVYAGKKDATDVSKQDPAKIIASTETEIGDRVSGNQSARVVIIEYADFQCPGCAGAHLQLKPIVEEYKDVIAFVFRNYPLTTIHPNALAASTAAETAGLQGKFWEMHDKLYENQRAWSSVLADKRTDVFTDYAREIGLDLAKFKKDLSDPRIANKISRDRALGTRLGVSSTPSVYLNDKVLGKEETTDLIQGSGDKLRSAIDSALKASGATPPARQ